MFKHKVITESSIPFVIFSNRNTPQTETCWPCLGFEHLR